MGKSVLPASLLDQIADESLALISSVDVVSLEKALKEVLLLQFGHGARKLALNPQLTALLIQSACV